VSARWEPDLEAERRRLDPPARRDITTRARVDVALCDLVGSLTDDELRDPILVVDLVDLVRQWAVNLERRAFDLETRDDLERLEAGS
jgi:hypothetical protein